MSYQIKIIIQYIKNKGYEIKKCYLMYNNTQFSGALKIVK